MFINDFTHCRADLIFRFPIYTCVCVQALSHGVMHISELFFNNDAIFLQPMIHNYFPAHWMTLVYICC